MRLSAVLLSMLLLLPSGAVAAVSAAVIASAKAEMEICCPPSGDSHQEHGPQLNYSCCQASLPFQSGEPTPDRQGSAAQLELAATPAPLAALVPVAPQTEALGNELRALAPRAPPWPLFLRFQRFLI